METIVMIFPNEVFWSIMKGFANVGKFKPALTLFTLLGSDA